jgi:hypothetical protein
MIGSWAFVGDNFNVLTTYYMPGTTGWSSTVWGYPSSGPAAVLWNPVIQTGGAGFGVNNNQFGFNIAGTAGLPIVVEVCTNLACPVWTPIQTNTLNNGSCCFSECLQTGSLSRFYRISPP